MTQEKTNPAAIQTQQGKDWSTLDILVFVILLPIFVHQRVRQFVGVRGSKQIDNRMTNAGVFSGVSCGRQFFVQTSSVHNRRYTCKHTDRKIPESHSAILLQFYMALIQSYIMAT